jgi:hypothetical protein
MKITRQEEQRPPIASLFSKQYATIQKVMSSDVSPIVFSVDEAGISDREDHETRKVVTLVTMGNSPIYKASVGDCIWIWCWKSFICFD